MYECLGQPGFAFVAKEGKGAHDCEHGRVVGAELLAEPVAEDAPWLPGEGEGPSLGLVGLEGGRVVGRDGGDVGERGDEQAGEGQQRRRERGHGRRGLSRGPGPAAAAAALSSW